MPIDLSLLNPPQREAVLHGAGPLVVFAGAGSGKTRVITHRVAMLVTDGKVPAWRILAVTFTNKAALEMRERLEHLVPGAARDLQVGTFHAMCARLLRRYAERAGVARDFVIYDEADQRAMINRVLRDLAVDDKRIPQRLVGAWIERLKNDMLPIERLEAGPDTETLRAILTEYERRMSAAHALDFGDLIYRFVLALEADGSLRTELAGRFVHVLIDEFQDTNHAQLRLALALTSEHRNLCVVGDDDQSIYRWRGADRRNILDFRSHFADAKVVKLERNYRSTRRILGAAHAVIERARDREPKKLWTDNEVGEPVDVVRCATEREEADLVVSTARDLARRGRGLGSLAVFYRVHAQSRVLEEALRAASLPYRVYGGIRFYDRAEIKDLLAYLRVIAVPGDDVSFLRIINTPTRGIGKTTVEKLLDRAKRDGTSVYEACRAASTERGAGKLAAVIALFEGLRAEAEDLSLSLLAARALEASGYLAALEAEDSAESDSRTQNLTELIGSMRQFEGSAAEPTLTAFLEAVTLDTSAAETDGSPSESISLMTVHAAKGLEFPVVIVTGLEEQLFPFRGTSPGDDPDELEEERRLAYVAFTRARERLILSFATTRFVFGNLKMPFRSRFLDELPASEVRFVGGGPERDRPRVNAAWIEDRGDGSHLERDGHQARGRALSRAPVVSAPERPRAAGSVSLGQRVRHVRYGLGTVVDIKGGEPPNVEVDFGAKYGVRTIRSDFLGPE